MPQPLPRTFAGQFSFAPDAVLERPKIAIYLPAILMHWNEIEAHIGVFISALLGAEVSIVMKIFFALNTDGGRKATIDTVTEQKLSREDLVRFREVQSSIARRYSERNRVAHGSWGISQSYPEDLLWYDGRSAVAAFPGLTHVSPEERLKQIAEINKSILIYKETDFSDILFRMKETYAALKAITTPHLAPFMEQMNKWPQANN